MKGGYQPSHDIEYNAGRSVNWRNDLAIGKKGEGIFSQFLKSFDNAKFEVKFDQYRNGRMVVEVEQNPRNKGWKPSGLMVTKAEWWIYIFSQDAFVAIETERLKKFLEINDKIEKKTFAGNTENPTRGYLLFPEQVSDLISSRNYDRRK